MKYEDLVIIKYLKSIGKKVKFNSQLQKLYNSEDLFETTCNMEVYNLEQAVPYLASGLSCYFNDYVDRNGLSNLKLAESDIEDANFIASCFGKIEFI